MKRTKKFVDSLNARVPDELQEPLSKLLKKGYNKAEIAKTGIRTLCKAEGIEVAT
jgi:hypothetical protein